MTSAPYDHKYPLGGEDEKQKISDLTKIKHALEHLFEACDGHGPLDECPIPEALDAGGQL